MPFKSKSQMRWMFANEPAMARRWAKETSGESRLPERASKAAKPQKPAKRGGKKTKR